MAQNISTFQHMFYMQHTMTGTPPIGLLMGLPLQLIYGDSMVIISWLNRISALDVPSLMHWCSDIRYMIHLIPPVNIKHTFREHNSLADELSKKDLHLDMGFVSFFRNIGWFGY